METVVIFEQILKDHQGKTFVVERDAGHTRTTIYSPDQPTFEEFRHDDGTFISSFHHLGPNKLTHHGVASFLTAKNEIVDVDYTDGVVGNYVARYVAEGSNKDRRGKLLELTQYVASEPFSEMRWSGLAAH